MKPYQERVVKERDELQEKYDKLRIFLSGESLTELAHRDITLLVQQADVMKRYLAILAERIAAFEL